MTAEAVLPFQTVNNNERLNNSDRHMTTYLPIFRLDKMILNPFNLQDNSRVDINRNPLTLYKVQKNSHYIYPEVKTQQTENTFSILNMNIKSVPSNVHIFIDLHLDDWSLNFHIMGFSEAIDFVLLYNLKGYNLNTINKDKINGISMHVCIYLMLIIHAYYRSAVWWNNTKNVFLQK